MVEPGKPLLWSSSDEHWAAFTASHSLANIFHHPAWLKLLAECYGYHPFVVVVSDADDNVRAGLPVMEVNSRLTGRRWVSLPFTDHCAPLSRDAESLNCLADRLVYFFQDHSVPKIELRCRFPTYPGVESQARYVLHTIKLDPDSEAVAKRFHPMHKRNIEAAQKRGVRIELGTKHEHLKAFYCLHTETRRRQGVPVQPWRFFDLLGSKIIEQGLGFVLLAYKDAECLAAAIFLHWQQTLTYKYGASSIAGLRLRPNNLLFGAAIRWGCENGYTLFDMGRTDLENVGLREFKNGWGTEEVLLTYCTLSASPSGTKTNKLIPIMHTIIRHSPLWVCRATGELLYKHFG